MRDFFGCDTSEEEEEGRRHRSRKRLTHLSSHKLWCAFNWSNLGNPRNIFQQFLLDLWSAESVKVKAGMHQQTFNNKQTALHVVFSSSSCSSSAQAVWSLSPLKIWPSHINDWQWWLRLLTTLQFPTIQDTLMSQREILLILTLLKFA